MQKTQPTKGQRVHTISAPGVLVLNSTPYGQLTIDGNGMTVHSGVTSGGQEVHSVKSKIDTTGAKPTITLQLGNGGKITMPVADAEVCFAQLLPKLAGINQGTGAAT